MSREEDWKNLHQPYELDYHKSYGVQWCSDEAQFQTFWGKIREFIQPEGAVLDIGCGPRPPFKGSYCVEPLADEYRKITPTEWWDGHVVQAVPAENAKAETLFDTVIIWNCLDHTADWRKVLSNAVDCTAEGGRIVVGVDFRPPCVGHPGVDKQEFFEAIKNLKELKRVENFQERDLAIILRK